jgi:hypothetical protein
MVDVADKKTADEEYLKQQLDNAAQAWTGVQKVKVDESRLTAFEEWNKKLEGTFKTYQATQAYENVTRIIEESVEQNQKAIVFHESNSCPEFWENTRLATGLNVAVPLLKSAQSLVDS